MKDIKTLKAEIFADTEKLYRTNRNLSRAIKHSEEGQKIYLEKDVINVPTALKEKNTEIKVSGKRSFEAAKEYTGKKVCVHNFASATNPGGGVKNGASAQEECLCRCSTLYANLNTTECWDNFYGPHRALHNPLYNADCIYTPDVVVFKSDTDSPELLPRTDWYKVDVITCAAPNLRQVKANNKNPMNPEKVYLSYNDLLEMHLNRGRRILDIARANGAEVVILGAFGCGAFQNSPEVVAESYRQLSEEYEGVFDTIEFAVYCPEHDKANYEVFSRIFRQAEKER